MMPTRETAATAFRVLNKCASEVTPDGPWRWRCALQNGALLPMAATLEEGFLRLSCIPGTGHKNNLKLERVLIGNRTLAGGVKLALGRDSKTLQMQADLVALEERHLLDRLRCALRGFHDGVHLLKSADARSGAAAIPVATCAAELGEILREATWPTKERGPNDFSAELDARSAPPASIRRSERGVDFSVELVRTNAAEEATQRALALFLLSISGALCMVRAFAQEAEGHQSYGLEVSLPATPAAEEIDHAMAALSVGYRMCAQEASVLLNAGAARCYLAARDVNLTQNPDEEKEN
jgi:hypothetical protein